MSLPFPQIHSLGFDKKSFSVPWAWRLIDNPQLYFSYIIVHGEKESSDYGMVGRMRKLINIHFLVIKLVILDANGSIRWRLFYLGHVCFSEFTFREITFQTFLCLFVIKKVGQRKIFSSQKKIWFGFQENVFSFIRWRLFYLDSFFFLSFAKKIYKLGLKNCFLVWVDILFLNQWNPNLREWMNLLRSQSVFLDVLNEKKNV